MRRATILSQWRMTKQLKTTKAVFLMLRVSRKNARVYKTSSKTDGYTALIFFLSKLNPECEALFQYPKRNWAPSDNVWYENRPLGVNKLSTMMKDISSAAGLSRIYTNHSVRATAITLWANAGLTNREIMAISGRGNESSLQSYHNMPSVPQLRKCCNVLTVALGDDKVQATNVGNERRPPLQELQVPSVNRAISSTQLCSVRCSVHARLEMSTSTITSHDRTILFPLNWVYYLSQMMEMLLFFISFHVWWKVQR